MPLILAAFLACVAPQEDRPRPLLDTDGSDPTTVPATLVQAPGSFVVPTGEADERLDPLPEPDSPACPGTGTWAFEVVNDCAGFDPLAILAPSNDPLRTDLVTGQAFADIDGDTWLDAIVVTQTEGVRVFLGSSSGLMTEAPSGLSQFTGLSVSVADVDHDGDPDLFIGGETDWILENAGGQLIDSEAVLGDPNLTYLGAWGDPDLDGSLDLLSVDFECTSCDPEATVCDRHGDDLWTDTGSGWARTSAWLFGETQLECGWGFAAAWGDLDNDGDPDAYVGNDRGMPIDDVPGELVHRNTYWRNELGSCPEGTCFSEVARDNGTAAFGGAMGVDFGDFDNDGDLDIAVADVHYTRIFENDGQGGFTEITPGVLGGPLTTYDSWGVLWLDYDNDGDLDLYTARTRDSTLHRNDGGAFTNVGLGGLQEVAFNMVGAAAADYDRDGRVDVLVGSPGNKFRLLRNTTDTTNNWVGLRLLGDGPGGRDALGARVWITDTSGRVQLREVKSGYSNGAGSDLGVHFGLGPETLDEVRVVWPDGLEEVVEVWENRWTVVDRLR